MSWRQKFAAGAPWAFSIAIIAAAQGFPKIGQTAAAIVGTAFSVAVMVGASFAFVFGIGMAAYKGGRPYGWGLIVAVLVAVLVLAHPDSFARGVHFALHGLVAG